MRLTEIKNGFVFPNNFILNSIENNGSESSGKNGIKSDVDYNSGHGNNTDNNNNNEECSMASKMNMNIEETTDEKKRKSKNKKEKKDKKDKKRKHKDIILNNNDDTNNNTKHNNDSNNDNNDNYNHDLNRSIDAGGESNVSVKKAKTKHPVPVPPSTTRVPYGTVRAPFSSLSLSEDRLSSVLQALKRGLLKTQLSGKLNLM